MTHPLSIFGILFLYFVAFIGGIYVRKYYEKKIADRKETKKLLKEWKDLEQGY